IVVGAVWYDAVFRALRGTFFDRRRRQVVRQRSAKPPSPVQIRAAPPILRKFDCAAVAYWCGSGDLNLSSTYGSPVNLTDAPVPKMNPPYDRSLFSVSSASPSREMRYNPHAWKTAPVVPAPAWRQSSSHRSTSRPTTPT